MLYAGVLNHAVSAASKTQTGTNTVVLISCFLASIKPSKFSSMCSLAPKDFLFTVSSSIAPHTDNGSVLRGTSPLPGDLGKVLSAKICFWGGLEIRWMILQHCCGAASSTWEQPDPRRLSSSVCSECGRTCCVTWCVMAALWFKSTRPSSAVLQTREAAQTYVEGFANLVIEQYFVRTVAKLRISSRLRDATTHE